MVAWIKANITIHLQPPAFLAASFSSCVVTLPSASCTEHCLSGHAWRCICACLYLCMCAPLLPTSRNKGGPTRERLEVSVKTPTDTGRWRKRRDRKSKEKGRVRWWWGGGVCPSSLVGSQEHRSVRWEHTVCTPVQTSWPPLPALVVASPSDTPPRSARRGRVCGGEVQLLRQAGIRE